MQERREVLDRPEIARRWFEQVYAPTVELLREAGLVGPKGETEAFIGLETKRYMLLRSHSVADDAMLEQLRKEL